MGTIRLVVFDLDGTPRATKIAGDPSPVMAGS
jgi:hypothetical protein